MPKCKNVAVRQPEKIVGAKLVKGMFMFVIKWQNLTELVQVPQHVAKIEWPQLVLDYYESILRNPKE